MAYSSNRPSGNDVEDPLVMDVENVNPIRKSPSDPSFPVRVGMDGSVKSSGMKRNSKSADFSRYIKEMEEAERGQRRSIRDSSRKGDRDRSHRSSRDRSERGGRDSTNRSSLDRSNRSGRDRTDRTSLSRKSQASCEERDLKVENEMSKDARRKKTMRRLCSIASAFICLTVTAFAAVLITAP